MRRGLRWVRRIVVGLIVLVTVAVAATLVILHTDWGREQLRGAVEGAIHGTYPGAKVGRVEGSVLGELVVRDVELPAYGVLPAITVKTLRLELGFRPLIGKTALVEWLVADGVTVTIDADAEPVPEEPTEEPSDWTVELPDVKVRGLTVTVLTPSGPQTIDGGEANAGIAVAPGGVVRAFAAAVGRWEQQGAAVVGLAAVRAADDVDIVSAFGTVAHPGGLAHAVATDLRIHLEDRLGLTGKLAVAATSPDVLPAGTAVATMSAAFGGVDTSLAISARHGIEVIDAALLADLEESTARGVIAARDVDLAGWSRGAVQGRGVVGASVVADAAGVRGTVIASAAGANVIASGDAVLDETQPDRWAASGLVLATAPGQARLAVVGGARGEGDAVTVEDTRVVAHVGDVATALLAVALAELELPAIAGTVDANLVASGSLDALAVRGDVDGRRLRIDELTVARVASRFDATIDQRKLDGNPARAVVGTAHVEASGVANAGAPVGAATVDVRARGTSSLEVTARARPAAAAVVVDADATVTPGDIIEIALGTHRVQTSTGELRGEGGRIVIDDDTIQVTGVRTVGIDAGTLAREERDRRLGLDKTSPIRLDQAADVRRQRGTRMAIDATIGRTNGAIDATIEARDLPASAIDPAYRGSASADVALTRRAGRWKGTARVVTRGIAMAPDAAPFDGEANISVDGRRVSLEARAAHTTYGGVRTVLVVDGPRDITDVEAWGRVRRSDLQEVTIGFDQLDLAALSDGATAGTVDGTLVIHAGTPSGSLAVRGVPTPAGTADADVTLALTDIGFVDANAEARLGRLGTAQLATRIAIPDRPFDPGTWKALGARVVDTASARTSEIQIDPVLLAQLGIDAPYRGRASVEATFGAGVSSSKIVVDLRDIRGGAIARPLAVHAELAADATATTGTLRVTEGKRVLVELADLHAAVSLDRWIAAPKAALGERVRGALVIPRQAVRDVLAIVGRGEVTSGTVDGKITLAGTLGAPTATGKLDLLAVRVRPRLAGQPPPMLTALTVEGGWDGTTVRLRVHGVEANERSKDTGTLLVEVAGKPADLTSVRGRVDIDTFDLAPVVVFLPGQLVGARGRLDADLRLTGVSEDLRGVRGTLVIKDGRVPVSTRLPTLRAIDAKVTIADSGLDAKVTARMGSQESVVAADAKATLDLSSITFSGKVRKVSPITLIQPVIDADLAGKLRRDGDRWVGTATVSRGSILVPTEIREELLDEVAPDDVYFVDLPLPAPKPASRVPVAPFVIVDVTIEPVAIRAPDLPVDAVAGGELRVAVGDVVGLDGELAITRGTAELNGHRYRIERGQLIFDGTTDGRVNLELAHDFPDATMFVRYRGRISEIGEAQPELASDPGIYTQGQLFGYFLGGSPSAADEQGSEATDAVVSFGAAFLFQTRIGRFLRKNARVDVLRCDPGTGVTSSSCTAGKWITKKAFLSYRGRINARPDENVHDAKLEYYIRPDIVTELSGGERIYGLDLLWRRKF